MNLDLLVTRKLQISDYSIRYVPVVHLYAPDALAKASSRHSQPILTIQFRKNDIREATSVFISCPASVPPAALFKIEKSHELACQTAYLFIAVSICLTVQSSCILNVHVRHGSYTDFNFCPAIHQLRNLFTQYSIIFNQASQTTVSLFAIPDAVIQSSSTSHLLYIERPYF